MSDKGGAACIKINKLLEAAGWRFFPEGNPPANIRLERSVTVKKTDLDALGDNFQKTAVGFIDLLLLDAGLGDRLPEGHAQPTAPHRGAGLGWGAGLVHQSVTILPVPLHEEQSCTPVP